MAVKSCMVIWGLNLFVLCAGLAGIVAGAAGSAWWVNEDSLRGKGLWEECKTYTECTSRKNILEFKDMTDPTMKNREKDAVLIVLIISALFALNGVIGELSMLCCQRNVDSWKCGALMTTLFAFIGAIAGIAALIYAEIEFKFDWKTNDHGWSVIICWIGAGLLVISFILSFTLICLNPPFKHSSLSESYSTQTNGYDRTGMAGRGAYANKGYELK